MAVRFILGRAGTGKTHRCFTRIVDAMRADPLGPPIFWVVPKQATFSFERLLTCASGLGGFCRARVVSFDLLGRQVLEDCGGTAVPQVTSYGRQMILGLLLRQHQGKLKFFSSVARQAGLAAKLDATFSELERCGKGSVDLQQVAADISGSQDSDADRQALAAKLHDMHLIYDAYCRYLGQERLDPHRRLQQVLATIQNCTLLRGSQVYVDGFLDFTEYERQILAGIAKACQDLEVTLLIDPESPTIANPHKLPEELSLFHKTEEAYRRLHFAFTGENIAIDPPVLLRKPQRYRTPALARVEAELFIPPAQQPQRSADAPCEGVELLEAPDRRAEADAAAGRVRDLLRQGYRLRDIAVLVRDPVAYLDLLSASFREHELPHFLDRRRSAAHHPLLQFMRSSLQVVLHEYPHDAMMSLLKSGLAGLSSDDADELENYCLEHRVRGAAWPAKESWEAKRARLLREDEELEPHEVVEVRHVDALRRRVADRLRPFVEAMSAQGLTVRQVILTLFRLFEAFGVRQTMGQWMEAAENAGEIEQRAEHEQVWAELAELFDQMAELLGDEPVTLPDFIEILESGLETFDLGLAPPTVDQVLIGQVDRTRSPHIRVAVLLGLNEGVFPLATREDSVLSDAERRALRDRKVETDPDSIRRQLDESLLGYIALTRASERLIVCRSTCDDAGKPLGPSVFWHELRAICPSLKPVRIPRETGGDPSLLATPRQLITSLMHWVRSGADMAAEPAWPALYAWLAAHETRTDAIDVMRYRAWHALSYANDSALSPEMIAKFFASPLVASASQLESFAACPFKHFARYGLRLETRVEEDPTAMDLGNVYHETLDRLVKSVLERRLDWSKLSAEQARQLVDSCAAEVARSLREELMLASARNRYLLTRIQRAVERVAAAQTAMAERGRFLPAYSELTFGFGEGGLPPLLLETPKARQLSLRGKIDRVDLLDDKAFSVVDYKMGDRRINYDELYHGLTLQLLTYLLVLDAHGQKLTGKKMSPAAAFYVRLLRSLEHVKHPDEGPDPSDPAFPLRQKPRGIVDAGYVAAFDSSLQPGGGSDVLAAYMKKDGTFSTSRSDVATSSELRALLDYVQKRLGELADQIIDGQIDIRPYKLGTTSACVNCDYRSLCRFHVRTNRYLPIRAVGRDGVLASILGGASGEDHGA